MNSSIHLTQSIGVSGCDEAQENYYKPLSPEEPASAKLRLLLPPQVFAT